MDATQIVLIVFIVLLIIIYPIMISTRNKKENQRMQEQTNSLKRGDKVLTTSGVYGTIVDLHLEGDKKIVTIETGSDKKKGYISVDAYAIYTIFKDEEPKTEEKPAVEDAKSADDNISTQTVKTEETKEENKENAELNQDVSSQEEKEITEVVADKKETKKKKSK